MGGAIATKCSRPLKVISASPTRLALAQGEAHGGHGARLRFVLGDEKVRPFKERRVDVAARDKMLRRHGFLSGKAKALEVLRLDDKIFSFLVLESFGDVFCLHIFIVRGLTVMNPFAGLAIDFVKGYLPR